MSEMHSVGPGMFHILYPIIPHLADWTLCIRDRRPCPSVSTSKKLTVVNLTLFDSDDPTIDETTRLRNRIAELESLVRELRGTRDILSISSQ